MVKKNVKNIDVQKILSPSLSNTNKKVLFAIYSNNICSGKFISNASPVSCADSLNALALLSFFSILVNLCAFFYLNRSNKPGYQYSHCFLNTPHATFIRLVLIASNCVIFMSLSSISSQFHL